MTKRSVSTRLRFEIFKRDGFRCLYCGASPLTSPLHVDHVIALANGGTNSTANLVTACKDCNLGKNAVPLERKALDTPVASQADKDHAQQILEFLAIQREVEAARTAAVDLVADRWEEVIGPMTQDMYSRLAMIVRDWKLEQIEEALQITARKMGTAGQPFVDWRAVKQAKYFQGILRRWRERS